MKARTLLANGAFWQLPKCLVKVLGFETVGYLSELVTLHDLFHDRIDSEGYFFQRMETIEENTGLSAYKQRKCLKTLKNYKIVDTKLKGLPAQLYYKINENNIMELVELCEIFFDQIRLRNEKFLYQDIKSFNILELKNLISTLYSNNIITKNITGATFKNEKKESKKTKPPKKKLDTKSKNKIYLPIAKYLAGIISKNRNVKISRTDLNNWTNQIRLLSTQQNIEYSRIMKALDWYSSNIGKPYVVVIHSGKSLREKFIGLESCIERSKQSKTSKRIQTAGQTILNTDKADDYFANLPKPKKFKDGNF